MKRALSTICAAALLTGCATQSFKFDESNADKGFVVFSTGYTEACADEFNNTAIILTPTSSAQEERRAVIKNLFSTPDFEENGALVHSFPLVAGDYLIAKINRPNKLFAFKMDYFPTEQPVRVTVEAGKINYLGSYLFDKRTGECSPEAYNMIKKDFKSRDMKKASEAQPELFSSL